MNRERPFSHTASETCRRSPKCHPSGHSLSSPSPPVPTVPSIPLRHASIATGRTSLENPYRMESCENSPTLLHCINKFPSNITSLATDSDSDLSSAVRPLPRYVDTNSGSPSFSLKQLLSKPLLLGHSSRENDRKHSSSQAMLLKPHASFSSSVRPSCGSDREASSSVCSSPTNTLSKVLRYTDTHPRSGSVPVDANVFGMDKCSRLNDNLSSIRQSMAAPSDAVGKGGRIDGKNKGTPQRNVLKRRQSTSSKSKHASVQSPSNPNKLSPRLFSPITLPHSKQIDNKPSFPTVETLNDTDSLPPPHGTQDVFVSSPQSSLDFTESRNQQLSDAYSSAQVLSEDASPILHKQTTKSISSTMPTRESHRITTDQPSPTDVHGDIEQPIHSILRRPPSGRQPFDQENGPPDNVSRRSKTHLELPKKRHPDQRLKSSKDVVADENIEHVALPYYTVFGSTSPQIPAGDSRDSYGASFGMLTETFWTTKTTVTAGHSRTDQEEKPALGRTLVRKLSGKFRRTEGRHDGERGRQPSRYSYTTPSTRRRSAEDVSENMGMPSPSKENFKTETPSKDKTGGLWRRISRSQSRSRDQSNEHIHDLPPLPALPNRYRASDIPQRNKHSSKNEEYKPSHSRNPGGLKKDQSPEMSRQSFLKATLVDFGASSVGYPISTPPSPPITTHPSSSSEGNLIEFRTSRSPPLLATSHNIVEPGSSLRRDNPLAKDPKRRRAKSLASRTVQEGTANHQSPLTSDLNLNTQSTAMFRRVSSDPNDREKSENLNSLPITLSGTRNALYLYTEVKEPPQIYNASNILPSGNSPPPRPQRSDKRPKPPSSSIDHLDDPMYPPVMRANRAVARLTFREMNNETRAVLTEKEKAEKWAALLKESDAAGGTLRLGGSDDKLPSDELRFSKTLSELALEI